MVSTEIFSSPIYYKYKSKVCSLSSLVVLIFLSLVLFSPFFLISNAGGFSLKDRIYFESPDTSFNYKYLLIADRDNIKPIVCSTFKTYKYNDIEDGCILTKIREVDTDIDGRKDALNFEVHLYTDKPISSVKLFLFFHFQLKQLLEASIESIAIFKHALNEEIQILQFFGDLTLQQNSHLTSESLYEVYNHSIEMFDNTIEEMIAQNLNKKFVARLNNEYVTKEASYSSDSPVVIKAELIYKEYLIYYRPDIWEELKWAWVQYISYFLVFAYIANHILSFLFVNRYLSCYVVIPWKNK